jgi:hypothetical protein
MRPVTLTVREAGDETERLLSHLQQELAEEARVLSTELPPLKDTTVRIEFIDGRSFDHAELRVREVLGAARHDWTELLRLA